MFAVEVTRFGPPGVLQPTDRPEPEPVAGELLIEVELAEVLFLDTQLRAGWGRDFFAVEPPFVPGVGVAGTVDGRRVIAGTSGAGAYGGGGYAELAVAPADMVFDVSATVSSADALAALHDGMMAFSRLGHTPVRPGDRALVTAAAGGIGVWLVPLLRAAGATVIAAARGADKLALARSRGAHTVVDYAEPDWTDGLGVVDVVFDGAGGALGTAALAITAPGGRFHAYGAAAGDFPVRRDDVETFGIDTPVDWRTATTRALEALTDGTVEPVIGQTVPLGHAADAHAAIEARRVLGKTLLEVR
jgi:NADPH2:quinone reductase